MSATFKLNGKTLSLAKANRSPRVHKYVSTLRFGTLTDRAALAKQFQCREDDFSIKSIPSELRCRLSHNRTVFGSARTISELKAELERQ